MQSQNYYAILGVARDATVEEIKKAFRKQALACHPDRHPDDPRAAENFCKLYDAYAVLADAQKRARYDHGESINESRKVNPHYPSWEEVMRDFFLRHIDARTAVDDVVADAGIPSVYFGGTMEGPTTGVELSSAEGYRIEKLDTALAGLVHTLDGTRQRNGERPWSPDILCRAARGLLQEGYLSDEEFLQYMGCIDEYDERLRDDQEVERIADAYDDSIQEGIEKQAIQREVKRREMIQNRKSDKKDDRDKELRAKLAIKIPRKAWGDMTGHERDEARKEARPFHDQTDKAHDSDKRKQMIQEFNKINKKAGLGR